MSRPYRVGIIGSSQRGGYGHGLDTAFKDIELFEEAVSIAASFACTIDTQESLLDLLFMGPEAFCFTIGRGVAHADQMLELLAAVTPSLGVPFQELQELVLRHSAAVSGCICLFVAWDEQRRELVRRLTAAGVPVLVLIIRAAGGPELERAPDEPAALHVLEAGQIEKGLARI